MDRLSEFELNASLQDALVAGGQAQLLRVSAQLLPAPAGGAAGAPPSAAGVQPRVQQLGRLRLRVEPGWPLSLVVGEGMLAQYNAVLVLLLQVRGSRSRAEPWGWGCAAGHGTCAHACACRQRPGIVDLAHIRTHAASKPRPCPAAALGQAVAAGGAVPRLEAGAARGPGRPRARRPAAPGGVAAGGVGCDGLL